MTTKILVIAGVFALLVGCFLCYRAAGRLNARAAAANAERLASTLRHHRDADLVDGAIDGVVAGEIDLAEARRRLAGVDVARVEARGAPLIQGYGWDDARRLVALLALGADPNQRVRAELTTWSGPVLAYAIKTSGRDAHLTLPRVEALLGGGADPDGRVRWCRQPLARESETGGGVLDYLTYRLQREVGGSASSATPAEAFLATASIQTLQEAAALLRAAGGRASGPWADTLDAGLAWRPSGRPAGTPAELYREALDTLGAAATPGAFVVATRAVAHDYLTHETLLGAPEWGLLVREIIRRSTADDGESRDALYALAFVLFNERYRHAEGWSAAAARLLLDHAESHADLRRHARYLLSREWVRRHPDHARLARARELGFGYEATYYATERGRPSTTGAPALRRELHWPNGDLRGTFELEP